MLEIKEFISWEIYYVGGFVSKQISLIQESNKIL